MCANGWDNLACHCLIEHKQKFTSILIRREVIKLSGLFRQGFLLFYLNLQNEALFQEIIKAVALIMINISTFR
jgi:hypothetical protein